MIRALAACALVCVVGSALAQNTATPNVPDVAPQPTIAVPTPVSISACNKAECPEGDRVANAEQPPSKYALLKQKLAEMNCLQSEIDELRRATGTPQQILVKLQVLEVSRTKLRRIAADLAAAPNQGRISKKQIDSLLDGTSGETGLRTFDDSKAVGAFIDWLRQNNVAKVLAEPTIVTTSGRPAQFNVGGELPISAVPGSNQSVNFINYGTQVDLLAIALGENRVKLDLRVRVSELNDEHAIAVNGNKVPAIRVRQIDTPIELQLGQTGVLTGSVQRNQETVKTGNRIMVNDSEIELLFLVTPQTADELTLKTYDGPSYDAAATYRTASSDSEEGPNERSLQVKPTDAR